MIDARTASMILADLANARDIEALQKIRANWPKISRQAALLVPVTFLRDEEGVPEDLRALSFLAYLLRRLWVGDEEATPKLEHILLTPDSSLTLAPSFFKLDWRRGDFFYQPQTDLHVALYHLLQHSGLTRICGNVDCVRPYFIAEHGNDRYCSESCFTIARKEAKRAWWGEHGEQWRHAREKLKRRDDKRRPRR